MIEKRNQMRNKIIIFAVTFITLISAIGLWLYIRRQTETYEPDRFVNQYQHMPPRAFFQKVE